MRLFFAPIQGIMVGFDWDWDFKVVEINLFIVSIIWVYGKTPYDQFIDGMM